MFDFLLKNVEISILFWLLIIAFIVFFVVKHEYIHQKIKGWIFIIIAFLLAFLNQYLLICFLWLILCLAIFEWKKLLSFSLLLNIFFSLIFIFLLWWFLVYIYFNLNIFFRIFVFISFSDIIAYTVGKNLPWMKWFTNFSPNKTLSWVLWQIFFLMVCLYFFLNFNIIVSLLFWILAPIWDLLESYFKRKAWIKDTADYIPWHGWVLDRIDSSFLSINLLLIFNLF